MKFRPFFVATFLTFTVFFSFSCRFLPADEPKNLTQVRTLAGTKDVRFHETFGIAVDNSSAVYTSDGDTGKIWKIQNGATTLLTDRLDTPSGLAFDEKNNRLIVADAGTSTIKAVNLANGEVSLVAGIENQFGSQDGEVAVATFNAPLAVATGKNGEIFVADTYNNMIRQIQNGNVQRIAPQINLDTPCGIVVVPNGDLIVADTGNGKIIHIALAGDLAVTNIAGNGEDDVKDGLAFNSSFIEPLAIAVDKNGVIYVADAGANAIRVIGRQPFFTVETLAGNFSRGFADGNLNEAKFVRPSGVAIGSDGTLFVADAGNSVVRAIIPEGREAGENVTPETVESLRLKADELKKMGAPRWTFNPPLRPREIAGTFGEVRGEIKQPTESARFHNGLDIAGGYGEAVYLLRAEKILLPQSVENVGGDRELIRFPTIGYIHLRLGRDAADKPFGDARFAISNYNNQLNVSVKRGAKFQAGEKLGTLNRYNHVHLIAGRIGDEMNALSALDLPGIKDTIAPKIEDVKIYDENWQDITKNNLFTGKLRLVVRTFDQMDGNAARRKLGVFALGYQILKADGTAFADEKTTISFEKLPASEASNSVYALGSQSGYTPETFFNYIVSNELKNGEVRENFLDTATLPNGAYKIRVFAADFFGNIAVKEINVGVKN